MYVYLSYCFIQGNALILYLSLCYSSLKCSFRHNLCHVYWLHNQALLMLNYALAHIVSLPILNAYHEILPIHRYDVREPSLPFETLNIDDLRLVEDFIFV
jgi:hypothetical protein